jgi:heat shock protein HtpX
LRAAPEETMNYFKTAILLAGMTALFMGVGYLIGGQAGMLLALVVAAGMNLFAYWNSDKMVLAMQVAQEVDESTAPELFRIVRELSQRAGLPMPRVYLMDSPQPNAFATPADHRRSAPRPSSCNAQARRDRQRHRAELTHRTRHDDDGHRDPRRRDFDAGIRLFFRGNRNNPLGDIGTIAMVILAPLAAMVVQMAISRSREYEADRGGAEISGRPLALASALQRLSHAAEQIPNEAAEANPATAHLFIVNPPAASMDNLFSTHPATGNRIAALGTTQDRRCGLNPHRERGARNPWQRARARGPWG